MALIERDLLGNETDKVKNAVEMLRMFERDDGYYVAYSGGKDSTVLLELMKMAGVKYDVHYAVTTVDPPELVRFIISQFDTVIYDMSDTPMRGHDKYFTTHMPGKLLSPITEKEIGGGYYLFQHPGNANAEADCRPENPADKTCKILLRSPERNQRKIPRHGNWCPMGGKPKQERKPRASDYH